MQIIASLPSVPPQDFLETLYQCPSEADVIEIRLDLNPGLDLEAAVTGTSKPILATLRSEVEGGRGPNDPETRSRILLRALECGAHLIDFEWNRDRDLLRRSGIEPERAILSWHDPSGTPEDIQSLAASMLEECSGLIKIVPTAKSLEDLGRILALVTDRNGLGRRDRSRIIAFAMGPVGLPSRFLAPLFGAPVSFVAWDEAREAAPGQQSAARMLRVAGHLAGPPRRLYGVVGADVSASLSPVLYGAAFRAAGEPDLMVPISVPDEAELGALLTHRGGTMFDRLGMEVHGYAVTTPYKAHAAAVATLTSPRMRRAGAANTLVLKPEAIVGENTDADGAVGSLKAQGIDVQGRTVLVQGTGGAARGAAVGLHLAGAEVLLRGRDADRARQVAEEIGVLWCDPDDCAGAEVLVNATPLGRSPEDPLPFDPDEMLLAAAVVDMVYGPTATPLVLHAREAGLTVVDGRRMLAFQMMAQFGAFTATPPPRGAILEAVEEF